LLIGKVTRREVLKAGVLLGAAATAAAAEQFFGLPFASSGRGRSRAPLSAEAARIIEETTVATFPDTVLVVTDAPYGAVGDGITDNTIAMRRSIEECASRGGGHVVIPAGVFSTGAVRLRSNVDVHLERGSVLRFNDRVGAYPLVPTRYEGIECVNHSPMVYAFQETNVALTGEGTLDAGQTRSWNTGSDRAGILEPMVAAGLSPEQRIVPDRGRLRSAFVEPYGCTNVLIQGVTLRGSQFWQLHPTLCRNVIIDSVRTGTTTNPNSDGCNPESCDHVVIQGCTFDAYDDCIALKSGRDADGRRVNTPCENVVITRCSLQGPAGGIALGSEMTGGIRNVYVHDVTTFGRSVQHALYVKSNTQRGGYATDVHIDGVSGDHLSGAWAFAQMDYYGQHGDFLPACHDLWVSNSTGDFLPLVFQLGGLDASPIRGLHVSDCAFTRVFLPFDFYDDVDGIEFDGVTINGRSVDR
jgi:polygalacturonase